MNNGKYYKKMIQLEKLQSQMRSIILPYYSREFIIGQTYVVKMKNHATRNLFRYTRQENNNPKNRLQAVTRPKEWKMIRREQVDLLPLQSALAIE